MGTSSKTFISGGVHGGFRATYLYRIQNIIFFISPLTNHLLILFFFHLSIISFFHFMSTFSFIILKDGNLRGTFVHTEDIEQAYVDVDLNMEVNVLSVRLYNRDDEYASIPFF